MGVVAVEKKAASRLPSQKTEALSEFDKTSILLYGAPKMGKSTIAASFPKPLFVMTEDGLKFLSSYQMPCNSWQDFVDIADAFLTEKHDYRTLVVDTADMLWLRCEEHVCKEAGIDSPSDLEWGKGFALVRTEFLKRIAPLTTPGKDGKTRFGLVFTSHERTAEVKGRVTKTLRTVPTLPGGARKVLIPLVDVIGHCGFERTEMGEVTEKRVVEFHPSDEVEAGDRSGRLPAQVPMRQKDWYGLVKRYFEGAPRTDENSGATPRVYGPKKRV